MASRNFVFTVKETGDGQPWLLLELQEDIGLGGDQHFAMHFPSGTKYAQAQSVARTINEQVEQVRLAKF